MSANVMPYDSTAILVPAEVLFWRTAENSKRLRISASDCAVEALVTRLDNDEWISVSHAGSYRQLLCGMFGQAQNAVSGFSLGPRSAKLVAAKPMPSPVRGTPEALLALVEKWLAEDDGYDDAAWPVIQQDIEENRLSDRSRFHG